MPSIVGTTSEQDVLLFLSNTYSQLNDLFITPKESAFTHAQARASLSMPFDPSTASPSTSSHLPPTSPFGALSILPNEILQAIAIHLPIPTFLAFSNTNRFARNLTLGIPLYRTILTHALPALHAVTRTHVDGTTTLLDLHRALVTPRCSFCAADFGPLFFVPLSVRCCFPCLLSHRQTQMFWEDECMGHLRKVDSRLVLSLPEASDGFKFGLDGVPRMRNLAYVNTRHRQKREPDGGRPQRARMIRECDLSRVLTMTAAHPIWGRGGGSVRRGLKTWQKLMVGRPAFFIDNMLGDVNFKTAVLLPCFGSVEDMKPKAEGESKKGEDGLSCRGCWMYSFVERGREIDLEDVEGERVLDAVKSQVRDRRRLPHSEKVHVGRMFLKHEFLEHVASCPFAQRLWREACEWRMWGRERFRTSRGWMNPDGSFAKSQFGI
ncbi:hypothetical protein OQA88_4834 [Cercophora sp. LCS_1]